MQRIAGLFLGLLLLQAASAQNPQRPKIVIGMMVDQMRWDYLYRYADRYGAGGFKRLLGEGFSCENTLINYAPTVTACGHTSVYTGTTPAVHGIIGNGWYVRSLGRDINCVEDTAMKGGMSPRNLLTTTVTDELRLATNFESKVVGVALKDRGAIFPAGHTANAAFWYDGKADGFTSSPYYMQELPQWVQRFNEQKLGEQYLANGWKTLYPIETYKQSTADNKDYERPFSGEPQPVFPHRIKNARATPYGNTLTLAFARAAIENYKLGGGKATDCLVMSLSSPDAVGHQFGPNSIEAEDVYLRLDQELETFFRYLDQRFGKNSYLFFITADHGVSQSPGFLEEQRLPTGLFDSDSISTAVNEAIREKFGIAKGLLAISSYQLYLNREAFDSAGIDQAAVEKVVIRVLMKQPGIANAVSLASLGAVALPQPARDMFVNGYNPQRGGDVLMVVQPGWKDGSRMGATHSLWYPYDAHIPLVWMGWGIRHGHTNRTVSITDIAPTLAALLHIQQPSGCTGSAITEITDAHTK
jgi:predicted AlkP superfamily pyrophosphatase or phosphodiesterase